MKPLASGSASSALGPADLASFLGDLLESCRADFGPPRRVLLVPPDQTRRHSRAGDLALALSRLLGPALKAVLPATGTHRAMGKADIASMYPGLDEGLFLAHDHRRAVVHRGAVESAFVEELSGGRLSFDFPGDFSRDLAEGGWDLVLSLGQVVPHEVVGMANYTKNLVVGLGGAQAIDRSHWLGAVAGLESIMGRAGTPVRSLLDESARRFLADLPIVYVLTVVSRDGEGGLALRGLFAGSNRDGSGRAAFEAAAALSAEVNIDRVGEAFRTCVVNLDPAEFRSTWLGNKAVYRTRMAMASGGDLYILAPGVDRFGEDPEVDRLIRAHGYRGTEATLAAVAGDPSLAANLAAAAHLVHGSAEGRFRITYCTEPGMRREVEGVGYSWMDLGEARSRFRVDGAAEGWNGSGSGRYFYVSNPALGLWKRADT